MGRELFATAGNGTDGYSPLLSNDLETRVEVGTTQPGGDLQPKIDQDCEMVATDFMLNADEDSVLRVLRRIQRARKNVLDKAGIGSQLLDASVAVASMAMPALNKEEQSNLASRLAQKKDVQGRVPIVQFSSPYYYCTEEEGSVCVEVMRFEPLDKMSVVRFRTKDATACAGEHYESVDKDVVFQPNQSTMEVHVPLVHTPDWNTMLEFEIFIENKDGESNAMLGRYGYHSRVKIIDTDSFPSSKFDGVPPDQIGEFEQLWEYYKVVWKVRKVWRGSMKILAVTMFRNLHFLAALVLNLFLVDSILNLDYDVENLIMSSRKTTLVILTSCMLALFAFHHLLDYSSLSFGVGGAQRLLLQRSVMRKFMNMEEEARQTVNIATLATAMTRDAPKLVASGYMCMFGLLEQVGNLVAILLFQVLAKFVFDKQLRPIAIFPMLITPPFLLCFNWLRTSGTHKAIDDRNRRQDELVEVVFDTCENYELIADYNRRAYFVAKLEEKVQNFHKSRRESKQRIMNNKYFAPWMSTICFQIYLVLGGLNVILGFTSLGMFLTNGKIIQELGRIWSEIYMVTMELTEAKPSLTRLSALINSPTDATSRMKLRRHLQQATAKLQHKYRANENPFLCYDSMAIQFSNIYLSQAKIRLSGKLEVQQGQFVILVGAHGSGKSSLLRVLSGRILPSDQDLASPSSIFFYPSHLRLLHVGAPLFFDESLMTNLTFGVKRNGGDGSPERVRAICKQLQVDQRIIDMLDEPFTKPWIGRMAATEATRLNIARAFITNPEIMIVHKPLDILRASSAEAMLQAFSEFVHEKGICSKKTSWLDARPRTCVITATKPNDVKFADQVFFVDENSRIIKQERDKIDASVFR